MSSRLSGLKIKIPLIFFLLISSIFKIQAQSTNPFGQLASQAPTKTLLERGRYMSMPPSGVDLRRHNGIIDDLNSTSDYIYEHLELVRSCDPSIAPGYPSHDDFYDHMEFVKWGYNPGNTPPSLLPSAPPFHGIISVTDWDYNTINPRH